MMKINVLQAKKEIGSQETFEFVTSAGEIDLEDESPWTGSEIKVDGELTNNGRVLKIKGVIHATAKYQCSYCLEDFTTQMDIPFGDDYQENSSEEVDEEADLAYYNGDEIDIADLVRESIILAEPLKIVCSKSCRGLCPQCGINLNTAKCSCSDDVIDPRLAVLSQLLK
ncbi:YceD family protein [Pelosinus sp. sgz500959]|uniref:YceD family protein n=1 Tax=Pelosinus sp. sgz500959 TaxID=3242472 RepID=UPI00366D7616